MQDESFLNFIDLIFIELFQQYLAINKVHFKIVKENKFKLINLIKLTTKITLNQNKIKVLIIGSNVALKACKKDALLAEVKGFLHFICCFLIYMKIPLYFTFNFLQKLL